jgi:hypothetical protein
VDEAQQHGALPDVPSHVHRAEWLRPSFAAGRVSSAERGHDAEGQACLRADPGAQQMGHARVALGGQVVGAGVMTKSIPVTRDDVLVLRHGRDYHGVEVSVGALLDALDVRTGGLILVLAGPGAVQTR